MDIIIRNILKCFNRNEHLLHKYDHDYILHFIPNLPNYNTRYKYKNNPLITHKSITLFVRDNFEMGTTTIF